MRQRAAGKVTGLANAKKPQDGMLVAGLPQPIFRFAHFAPACAGHGGGLLGRLVFLAFGLGFARWFI